MCRSRRTAAACIHALSKRLGGSRRLHTRPARRPRSDTIRRRAAIAPTAKTEKLLTGDTAARVKAAAKAKVPGGTVERVETDADTGAPYEAHVRKADGSQVVVYVDASFNVTGTETMGHP